MLDSSIREYKNSEQKYFREVVNNYYEAEYRISENKGEFTWDAAYYINLKIIYIDSLIISYKLIERKNAIVDTLTKENYERTEEFWYSNDSLFADFKHKFLKVFGKELNPEELHNPILFGNQFGNSGAPPDGEVIVKKLVKERNKTALVEMLKSTKFEIQLYGIKGLRQLERTGIKLNEIEKLLISSILAKKGLVYEANGCSPEYTDVLKIIENYKLQGQ